MCKMIKVSEHDEQVIIKKYCDIKKIPMYANPNGVYFPIPQWLPMTFRNRLKLAIQKVLSKMKAEGAFKKGLLDFTIPVKTKNYGALYIELKVGKNKATKEQLEWKELLEKNGNKCEVCYGSSEAIKAIEEYLNNGSETKR